MMTRAAVITIGSKNESLGAFKLASWLEGKGYDVVTKNRVDPLFDRFDLWCFSVVFSWRLPLLVQEVRAAQNLGGEVWIGGPAVTFHPRNWAYVLDETGIEPHFGLDDRFDREQTDSPMVYFSRGCPAYTPACGNCPVPRLEGTSFRYYPDSRPARMLMDNNLSALPCDYQQHIVQRYQQDWKGGKVDANSGFEPHSFTEETLEIWRDFPLECWRFGYDDLTEREQSLAMMELLRSSGFKGRRVRVYCLIGNEPIRDCHKRLTEIIDNGCEPRPQRLRPLDWRGGPLPTRHDWDEPTLIAFQRYYTCPQLWKTVKPTDFYYQGRYPIRESCAGAET